MKKYILFLLIGSSLFSCADNKSSAPTESQPTAATKKTDPNIEKGLQLVATNDCFSCHKIKDVAIGPAYEAIATKYQSNNSQVIDSLSQKIIKGGVGNWGSVPMTPHPNLSNEDANLMVQYILSLKP